jgi:hypothetical protein
VVVLISFHFPNSAPGFRHPSYFANPLSRRRCANPYRPTPHLHKLYSTRACVFLHLTCFGTLHDLQTRLHTSGCIFGAKGQQ